MLLSPVGSLLKPPVKVINPTILQVNAINTFITIIYLISIYTAKQNAHSPSYIYLFFES